jgi:putative addiction module CopG family antidote
MNATLTPELERRIREKVERGDYDHADALMQEAVLRLIEEDEMDLDSIRTRLGQADAEIDRGEGSDFDENTTSNLARDIHAGGMKRLAELRKTGTRG